MPSGVLDLGVAWGDSGLEITVIEHNLKVLIVWTLLKGLCWGRLFSETP